MQTPGCRVVTLKTCQGAWEAVPSLWVWLQNPPRSHSWGATAELGCRQGCAARPAFGNAGVASAQPPC